MCRKMFKVEGHNIDVSYFGALRRKFFGAHPLQLIFMSVGSNVGSATKGPHSPPAMPLGRFWWGESTCGATIGDGGHTYPHTFQKWGGRGQQSCGDDLIVYWKTTAEHNDRVRAVLKNGRKWVIAPQSEKVVKSILHLIFNAPLFSYLALLTSRQFTKANQATTSFCVIRI